MPDLNFFARARELLPRFQKVIAAADDSGDAETASRNRTVATALEALLARDANEPHAVDQTASEITPQELTAWREASGYHVIEFAARLNCPASDIDDMEAGRMTIPQRFGRDVPLIVAQAGTVRG